MWPPWAEPGPRARGVQVCSQVPGAGRAWCLPSCPGMLVAAMKQTLAWCSPWLLLTGSLLALEVRAEEPTPAPPEAVAVEPVSPGEEPAPAAPPFYARLLVEAGGGALGMIGGMQLAQVVPRGAAGGMDVVLVPAIIAGSVTAGTTIGGGLMGGRGNFFITLLGAGVGVAANELLIPQSSLTDPQLATWGPVLRFALPIATSILAYEVSNAFAGPPPPSTAGSVSLAPLVGVSPGSAVLGLQGRF